MATATPLPGTPEGPRVSTFGRLFGALFSPKETFADIARSPGWITPVILYIVMGLTVTGIFTVRVGWENFMRQRLEQNPRFADLPADQKQRQLEMAAKTAPIFGSIGVVVANFVMPLLVGGVLMGAFRITSGADVKYKQALGAVSHAYMPLAVSGLLGILILFLKDPAQADLENLVASNVGALLSGDSPKWLQSLGQSLDLFAFWVIFLLAVGFSAIDPKKIKMGGALGVIIGLWVVYLLGKVGIAAAFS